MRHVIVGNGVAGVTAAQEIRRSDESAEVHIYSEEPYPYYRRPLLWGFIAGQVEQEALYFRPIAWYAERGIHLHLGLSVTALDPAAHHLTLADGSTTAYDRLLLATGGRAFVPPCAGTDRPGVFTLRTLDDALAIKAHAGTISTAVVIGGGLLGLETARALHTAGLEVTVVEVFPYLLPRQLDVEGAQVLQALLEAQGLHVLTGGTVKAILGDERTTGIQLQDGVDEGDARDTPVPYITHARRTVPGELVLFSTGIRSEVSLAKAAGLAVHRGIIVDSHLQTSAEDIFAAGDAAEFEGRVYGIIPPAIEQARVAAAHMVATGGPTHTSNTAYNGSLPTTTLKVAGAELTSLGECIPEGTAYTQLRHTDLAAGRYRKLVLREGRVVGAILLNDPARVRPVTQLIEQGVDVSAYTDRLVEDDFDLKSLA